MSAIIKAPSLAPSDFTTLASEIWAQIQSSHKILLHFHPNPDPDSVGSTLAMGLMLEKLGKQVTIISGDTAMDLWVNQLPGYHLIRSTNLSKLNLSGYDLFLILDSSSPSQISDLVDFQPPSNLYTIIIDHHPTNQKFAHLNLIVNTASSTCELVYRLINFWKQTITPDLAVNLYIGLNFDTVGFGGSNTTSDTLKIAADLARINPNFPAAVFAISNSSTPENITILTSYLRSIKVYFKGQVAITSGLSASPFITEKIISLMRSVIGWDIVVVIKQLSPARCRISFRTRDSQKYDLSKLAVALGGGGQPFAAGATLDLSLPLARKKVLAAIKTSFPDLYKKEIDL